MGGAGGAASSRERPAGASFDRATIRHLRAVASGIGINPKTFAQRRKREAVEDIRANAWRARQQCAEPTARLPCRGSRESRCLRRLLRQESRSFLHPSDPRQDLRPRPRCSFLIRAPRRPSRFPCRHGGSLGSAIFFPGGMSPRRQVARFAFHVPGLLHELTAWDYRSQSPWEPADTGHRRPGISLMESMCPHRGCESALSEVTIYRKLLTFLPLIGGNGAAEGH